MNNRRTLVKVINGSRNVRFTEFTALVEAFGFRLSRVRGSHHIYTHPLVDEILNLQPRRDQAKLYQMRQFLDLVETYDLKLPEES